MPVGVPIYPSSAWVLVKEAASPQLPVCVCVCVCITQINSVTLSLRGYKDCPLENPFGPPLVATPLSSINRLLSRLPMDNPLPSSNFHTNKQDVAPSQVKSDHSHLHLGKDIGSYFSH